MVAYPVLPKRIYAPIDRANMLLRRPRVPSQWVRWFCVIWIGALAFLNWVPLYSSKPVRYWFMIALLLVVVAVVLDWFKMEFMIIAVLMTAALFCLAAWRLDLTQQNNQWWQKLDGKKITFEGQIASEPMININDQRIIIAPQKIISPENITIGSEKILVVAPLEPRYFTGELIKMFCALRLPAKVVNKNYARYLAKDEIYAICYQPTINRLSFKQDTVEWLTVLKQKGRQAIVRSLPEPQAGLLLGITLGDQKALTPELKTALSRAGLTHIVAISGMNFTLLAAAVLWALLGLGLWRRQTYLITIALLWLYLVFIGWPASAWRAAVMSSLVLIGLWFGRPARISQAIIIAAAIMLACNPKLIRADMGFVLSFLALISIIVIYPRIKPWFTWSRVRWLGEGVAVTLAAQVLTWPVMALAFGQISVVAPLANAMVLWAVPAITIGGLIGVVLGWFWLPLAQLVFLPVGWLSQYLITVGLWFGRQPWSAVDSSNWSIVIYGVYYIGIASWVWQSKTDNILRIFDDEVEKI
ncbi:MAG: ComEC/Rec2 family competence protein [Candidatus Falkowbacteria bacterium]